MVAAIATVATIQTEPLEIPVTFGAFGPMPQGGGGVLVFGLVLAGPLGERKASPTAIGGALVLAGAVALAALAWWHHRHRRAVPPHPDDDPTIEIEREAVWYQLPPEKPDRPQ